MINKEGSPIDFNALIASQQGAVSQNLISNYALFQVSRALGIAVTVQTNNFSAFTLEIRKDVAKRDSAANAFQQST